MPANPRSATGNRLAERAALCLDFANTVDWHASAHPRETLHGYDDLVTWAAAHAVVGRPQADALRRRAHDATTAADRVHRRAVTLREAIYRIFVARASGAPPSADDVQRLNAELQLALPHYRVAFGDDGAAWRLVPQGPGASLAADLDFLLWPIVQSAVELMLSPELAGRVGQCADTQGCGWLFLDLSRNRSRRWCSISDCGNRAKQQRLQARLKQAR